MYADDTHVTVTSMNVEELVHKAQEELTHISEYMRLNKLSQSSKNRASTKEPYPLWININI